MSKKDKDKYKEPVKIETDFEDTVKALLNTKPLPKKEPKK